MVLEIVSIGDGEMLYRVLQGIALFAGADGSGYGVLGRIGAAMGLLLIVWKTALDGSAGFKPVHLLVGMLLFGFMFVPKVDVLVVGTTPSLASTVNATSVVPGPLGLLLGGAAPTDRVVSSVPLGPAAIGSIVSRTGRYLSDRMEQAMSLPDQLSMTRSGSASPMRSLMLLRELTYSPAIGTGPAMQAHAKNLRNYISWCYQTKQHLMGSTADALASSRDPMAELRWDNHYRHVEVFSVGEDGALSRSVEDCSAAYQRLLTPSSQAFKSAVDVALAERTRMPGATDRIARDMSAIISNGAEASQKLMAAALLVGVLQEAPNGTQQLMGSVMINQAQQQRQVQWAGEGNLFMRSVKTTGAFLESLFYATSPFLALMVCLGPLGMRMVGKYATFAISVALWFPLLAVVNLYLNVQMGQALAVLSSAGGVDGDGSFGTSLPDFVAIMQVAQEGVATAGLLAGAIPILANAVMFGGAVALGALSARLAGGDHIQESTVTPDAVRMGGLLSQQPLYTGSPGGSGTMLSGSENQQLSYSAAQVRQETESSARQLNESQQVNAARSLDAMISKTQGIDDGFATELGGQARLLDQQSHGREASLTKGSGEGSAGQASTDTRGSDTTRVAVDAGAQGQLGLGSELLKKAVLLAKLGASVGVKATDEEAYGRSGATAANVSREGGLRESDGERASRTLNKEEVAALNNMVRTAASRTLSASDQERLTQAWGEAQQRSEQYSQISAENQSGGASFEFKPSQWATAEVRQWMSEGGQDRVDDEMGRRVHELGGVGGAQAYRENLGALEAGSDIADPNERRAAAYVMTVMGGGVGGHYGDESKADELLGLQRNVVADYGRFGSGAADMMPSGDASAHSGIAGGAPAEGSVRSKVESVVRDLPVTRESIASSVASREGQAVGAVDAVQQRQQENQVNPTQTLRDDAALNQTGADNAGAVRIAAAERLETFMKGHPELHQLGAPAQHVASFLNDAGQSFDAFKHAVATPFTFAADVASGAAFGETRNAGQLAAVDRNYGGLVTAMVDEGKSPDDARIIAAAAIGASGEKPTAAIRAEMEQIRDQDPTTFVDRSRSAIGGILPLADRAVDNLSVDRRPN